LTTYKRALGQWGFCPAGFFIFYSLFLSEDWVKATRSVPKGLALTQVQRPTLTEGAGFKPSPASHMAANGFPTGEREGGLKSPARDISEPLAKPPCFYHPMGS